MLSAKNFVNCSWNTKKEIDKARNANKVNNNKVRINEVFSFSLNFGKNFVIPFWEPSSTSGEEKEEILTNVLQRPISSGVKYFGISTTTFKKPTNTPV